MAQLVATSGEALLRAHRELLESLDGLRLAVDQRPPEEGPASLAARLTSARLLLVQHFDLEEQNGYMSSMLEEQPHLTRTAQRLHEEHDHLLATLNRLITGARSSPAITDDVRERVREWLKAVRSHEQAENVMLQDAFGLDLASGD